MALTFNGSANTIGGLAVGGLPDGVVDTDMIAANAVTAAKRGSGAILQIVSTNKDSTFSSNATSFTSIGLSATITPSSSSNKILVLLNLVYGGPQNHYAYGKIIRTPSGGSATDIALGADRTSSFSLSQRASFSLTTPNSASAEFKLNHASVNFLDSPNTTAATTYAVQGYSRSGGGDGYFYINRPYTPNNQTYQVGN